MPSTVIFVCQGRAATKALRRRAPRTNFPLPSRHGSALRHWEVANCPEVADSVDARACPQKTADIDGLRSPPDDPHYGLGPVHTSLYVQVTWDWWLGHLPGERHHFFCTLFLTTLAKSDTKKKFPEIGQVFPLLFWYLFFPLIWCPFAGATLTLPSSTCQSRLNECYSLLESATHCSSCYS